VSSTFATSLLSRPATLNRIPTFFQVVYAAQACYFDPGGREEVGYELGAESQPIAEVQRLPLLPSEQVFLGAALGGVSNAGPDGV
jgi:hypothetical protein